VLEIVDLYALEHDRASWHYWIDHTPENVRYGSTLASEFPNAKFIHIVRDGRAVANSVLGLEWGPTTAREAADWWTQRVGFGLALESHLGSRSLRVRYEDLVENQERVLKDILAFVDPPQSALSQREHGFDIPEYTKRQHQLVNRDAVASRSEAWRTELDIYDISAFEDRCWDFLTYLGYERITDKRIRPGKKARIMRRIKAIGRLFKLRRYEKSKRRRALSEEA